MTDYVPDRWAVIKIGDADNHHFRVFGSWRGGYLDGERWRLNSGITKVEETEHDYFFTGETGSVYQCRKGAYGATSYGSMVIAKNIEDVSAQGTTIEVLEEDTDFAQLIVTKE